MREIKLMATECAVLRSPLRSCLAFALLNILIRKAWTVTAHPRIPVQMRPQASPSKSNSPGVKNRTNKLQRPAVKLVTQADTLAVASGLYSGPEKLVARKLPCCGADIGKLEEPSMEPMLQENVDPTPLEVIKTAPYSHTVEELVELIRKGKTPAERKPLDVTDVPAEDICLVGEQSGKIRWIQPSGPRATGQGIEDDEQAILSAEATSSGGAMLRITLLASGFVIGPSGSSVRDTSKATGADIKSWTDKSDRRHPSRTFVIEGRRRAVVLAIEIICEAVQRYKELCEGAYCGQSVERIQMVRGIEFCYQPPPRSAVPYAAALKGQNGRSPKSGRKGCLSSDEAEGAQAYLQASKGALCSKKGAKDSLILSHPGHALRLGYGVLPQPALTPSQDFGFETAPPLGYSAAALSQQPGLCNAQLLYDCDSGPLTSALQQLEIGALQQKLGHGGIPYPLMYSAAQQISDNGAKPYGSPHTGQLLEQLQPQGPLSHACDASVVRQLALTTPQGAPETDTSSLLKEAQAGIAARAEQHAASTADESQPPQNSAGVIDKDALEAHFGNSSDHKPPLLLEQSDACVPAIPAGYVLIPPNFLVTIESLRKAGFATMGDAIATLTNKVDRHSYGFPLAGTSGYNAGFTNSNQGSRVLPNHVAITNPLEIIRVPDLNLHPNNVAYNPASFSTSPGTEEASGSPMPWVQGAHPFLQADEAAAVAAESATDESLKNQLGSVKM